MHICVCRLLYTHADTPLASSRVVAAAAALIVMLMGMQRKTQRWASHFPWITCAAFCLPHLRPADVCICTISVDAGPWVHLSRAY